MKAIVINSQNKTIEFLNLNKGLDSINAAIGNNCSCFCCPFIFENDDTIYADDEILLRPDDIHGGFTINGFISPIVGNAIILGTDSEGDSVDALTDIDDVRSKVIFFSKSIAIEYAERVMNQPIQIITF